MEIPWYNTKVGKDLKLSRDKFQGSYRPKLEMWRVTVVVISFTGGVREVEDVAGTSCLGQVHGGGWMAGDRQRNSQKTAMKRNAKVKATQKDFDRERATYWGISLSFNCSLSHAHTYDSQLIKLTSGRDRCINHPMKSSSYPCISAFPFRNTLITKEIQTSQRTSALYSLPASSGSFPYPTLFESNSFRRCIDPQCIPVCEPFVRTTSGLSHEHAT